MEMDNHYKKLEADLAQNKSALEKLHEEVHKLFEQWEQIHPFFEHFSNLSRGFAQVVFLDNPLSGAFIIAAIALAQPKDLLLSSIVTVSGWLFFVSLMGNLKDRGLNTGLYLYNSVLVGMAIGVFYSSKNTEDSIFRWVSVVGFGIAAIGVQLVLESLVPGQPIFTFPFNITMVFFLHLAYAAQWVDIDLIGQDISKADDFKYSLYLKSLQPWSLFKAICNGFCQVYLVESWIAGALMFLGMCVEDLELAALALLGSIQGTMVAVTLGCDIGSVYAGLFGYNPLLVTMAVGKVFTSEYTRRQRWLAAIFFGFATFPVESSLRIILAKIHVPVMTFPFCIMTFFFFCIRNWVRQHPRGAKQEESGIIQEIGEYRDIASHKDLFEKSLQASSLPNTAFSSTNNRLLAGREMTV